MARECTNFFQENRLFHLINLVAAINTSSALLQAPVDPSFDAIVNRGTFENPSAEVRPKFRYWVPDASVDPDVVAKDVRGAGVIGAGGLELLGYYLYGGPPSNGAGRGTYAPVDWAKYGFGTPAWQNVFRTFAQAHKDNNLVMDFALGPNQGTGVPAPADDEGLMWDIVAYNLSVPIGGSFNSVLPGWGVGTLEAAIAGTVLSSAKRTVKDPPGGLPGDVPLARTEYTLSASSLTDVTDQVDKSGKLKFNFSSFNGTGTNHVIFTIYLVHSHYHAQAGPTNIKGPQSKPQSYLQNGSWAVDHFSALGARTLTKFWEDYLLTNGTRELVREVGNYAWEDSVEIEANVYWTKNFSNIFLEKNGYSVKKWLPLLFHRNGKYKQSNPGVWWITDEGGGSEYIADYRSTASLASQYQIYESELNKWAEEYLNLQFSAQLSYNLPMDMLANIPTVDAPETESLDFSDLIDGYRQYSGPANLARRRIISSECGAVRGQAYVQTLPELLWKVKRSYAGSVNQFVFHGLPYSGQYGNTTWPTWTTFNYQYSGMHGPHEPAWEFYKDHLDFVARNNWVFQSGIPRLDIAIYQKITVYPGHIQLRTYEPADLETIGYSYEYLSPDNFKLPSVKVVNGILAPDAQAFKAIVVRANDSLTVDGATNLVKFAEAGFPVIFAGGVPSIFLGTNRPEVIQKVKQDLLASTKLVNVHTTSSYLVASTLARLGIQPLTKISTNGSWYTYWRSDVSTGIEYIFIYNDAMHKPQGSGSSEGTIEFQSTGIPYEYNAWTGEKLPILAYTRTNTSTIIPMRLAGNQSTIVAFLPFSGKIKRPPHLTQVSSEVLGLKTSPNGTITVKIASTTNFLTSNSTINSVPVAVAAVAFSLKNWILVVEHWDPPSDLYNYTDGAYRHNTTHHLQDLVSWQDIPGLKNVSGRGYYSTTFIWPPSSSSSAGIENATKPSGAFLNFGAVYHTLRASLNGHHLPPLDVTDAQTDITPFLVDGINVVEAVIATPLGNVLRPMWDKLMSSGESPSSPDAGARNGFVAPPLGVYGLGLGGNGGRGGVWVVPYVEAAVEGS
ncbi:hypothetical protein GQ43DRAFT_477176 [Delitschia confertaspora ATCC 74209]|uniref:Secreted protein n=1 Tax=Delitschia confertaspora ATCC 74209 TaxID=1513339 RepID=A0A9P4JV22_9PLEO|nr:hypothetical protein GQ43DRAFT_477176 [Delitschia confertaspora ATCC 74209]